MHAGGQARAQQAFKGGGNCTGGDELLVNCLGQGKRVLDACVADAVVAGADYLQNQHCELEHVTALLVNQAAANVLPLAVGAARNGTRCSAVEQCIRAKTQQRRMLGASSNPWECMEKRLARHGEAHL